MHPELTPQQLREIRILTPEHEAKLIDFLDRQREALEIERQVAENRREMFLDAFSVVAAVVITAALCLAVWAN